MKPTPLAEWLKPLLVPLILLPIPIWAAPALWHWLQAQVPDSILSRLVALLFVVAVSCVFSIFRLLRELDPIHRDDRLRAKYLHNTTSDISTHRKDGTRICTKCLHRTPALAYPLHDRYGQGRWDCGGCGDTYRDENNLAAERENKTQKTQPGSAFS